MSYNLKPNDKYYSYLGEYSLSFLKSIEKDATKIEFFQEKVLLSLACSYNQKYVCLFNQCIKRSSTFKTKQTYKRHLLTQHKDELPGGGEFLTASSQHYTHQECKFCGHVFPRKDKFDAHFRTSPSCSKQKLDSSSTEDTNQHSEVTSPKVSGLNKIHGYFKHAEKVHSASATSAASSTSSHLSSKAKKINSLVVESDDLVFNSDDDSTDITTKLDNYIEMTEQNSKKDSLSSGSKSLIARDYSSNSIADCNADKRTKLDSCKDTSLHNDDANSDADSDTQELIYYMKKSGFLDYLNKNNL
jgi:hypothetical protein